ncbi:MAG: peptidase M17 [Betaproteobacteria bacterium RIFCSPLOWO2_02_64_14]|nr:MAG: peptidase M17 [Betaproteobacteria bacterium RIFCSPLOWO2_02_64_14]
MLARLEQRAAPLAAAPASRIRHLLVVLPKTASPGDLARLPFTAALKAALARRRKKLADLAKAPVSTDLPNGGLASWVAFDPEQAAFERHTAMRKAVQALLAEHPREIVVAVYGTGAACSEAARAAVYAAWVNGARLPQRKKKSDGPGLARIVLYGVDADIGAAALRAQAEGNLLCRELTVLPPNELTPGAYRARVEQLAEEHGWGHQEYDVARLRKMGAGAFVAVAQGSDPEDAAIVHLAYRHRAASRSVALVGKGICFDTGGHNLKTARYMHGMHEDMNGSAVALAIVLAAARSKLPVNIDCWLALAQNHLSPRAYKQNEVVKALNGTTIEIVHTDAEGRMVLADTLTLAARARPDLIVDFATLTGSMHVALGARYSGIFATSDQLARTALAAGAASGERVCVFPMDEDYDEALDSTIADVKQCTLEGEADHILAARFLKRFTAGRPWIHMDLSGSSCKGGLGAVASEVTGFGVGWGLAFLQSWLAAAGAPGRSSRSTQEP